MPASSPKLRQIALLMPRPWVRAGFSVASVLPIGSNMRWAQPGEAIQRVGPLIIQQILVKGGRPMAKNNLDLSDDGFKTIIGDENEIDGLPNQLVRLLHLRIGHLALFDR